MTAKNTPQKRRRSITDVKSESNSVIRSTRDAGGHEVGHRNRESASVPLHVHECSFVKPHVPGFSAISTTRCGTRLAIATTDGIVQLHQRSDHWKPVSVVFPDSGRPELAVSSLKFSPCDRYLFISRLDGSLSLYSVSFEGLLPHVTLQPGGGAIWDMAFQDLLSKGQFLLAIACDDGRVRFVQPDPDYSSLDPAAPYPNESSHYTISLGEKSSDRVLCVTWGTTSKGDSYVVCGDSAGRIRWIGAKSGRSWGNAQIAPVRRNPVLIWTVLAIDNGSVVICGDSRGLVTIWSSRSRTMLAEVHIEGIRGAIWCSSFWPYRDHENCVVVGCANGGVGGLSLKNGGSSWNSIRASLLHTHDVRGVAPLPDGHFVTASIDGQVLLFSVDSLFDSSVKVSRLEMNDGTLAQPPVQFSPDAKLLVARGKDTLEFCHVPMDSEGSPSLRLRMVLRGLGSPLRSFAISRSSHFVALSSGDSFKLYKVWDGTGGQDSLSLSFGKVCPMSVDGVIEGAMWGCVDLAFGGDILAAISRSRTRVILYNVKTGRVKHVGIFEIKCAGKLLSKIACSDGRVAVSDSSGSVYTAVISSESLNGALEWAKVGEGSMFGDNVTCLAISPSGQRIAFAYRSGEMRMVFLKEGTMKTLSGKFLMIFNAITFGRSEKGLLASGLKDAFVVSWIQNKKSKGGSDGRSPGLKCFQIHLPGQVWSCGVWGVGRIIAVRKHADLIQEYLPDAIPKKKYAA